MLWLRKSLNRWKWNSLFLQTAKNIFSHTALMVVVIIVKTKHCYLGITRAGKSFCTLSRPSSPRIKFSQRRESPFFGENPIIFIGVIPSCHRDIKNQFVGLNADDWWSTQVKPHTRWSRTSLPRSFPFPVSSHDSHYYDEGGFSQEEKEIFKIDIDDKVRLGLMYNNGCGI